MKIKARIVSFLSFVAALTLAQAALAAPTPLKGAFQCVTTTPTTSVITEVKGDLLNVRVINHFGVKYMPIHDSLLTSGDIGALEKRAQMVQGLDDQFEFSFPLNKCGQYADGIISCTHGSTITSSKGKTYNFFSMSLSRTTVQFEDYFFRRRELMFLVSHANESFTIPMRYELHECKFQ